MTSTKPIFMLFALAYVTAMPFAGLNNLQGMPMNVTCMTNYCGHQTKQCMGDKQCRKNLACSAGCMANWGKDPTPDKVHAQNCTTKCGVTYEDDIIDDYMTCMMSHKCISFPPIDVQCPQGLEEFIQPDASLDSLKGEWWQHYGHNALWDCYPCQHIHSMDLQNETDWAYTYSYELFTVGEDLKYFQQTWQLPNPPAGEVANITYEYLGTLHNESWYILEATERYVVLVDCSYMFTWTNVGTIVWVRPELVLTEAELASIAAVYKKALGWNFPQDFCYDRHGDEDCPSGPAAVPPGTHAELAASTIFPFETNNVARLTRE